MTMKTFKHFCVGNIWICFWAIFCISDCMGSESLVVETSASLVRVGHGFPVQVSALRDGMPDPASVQEVELQGVVERTPPQVLISQFQTSKNSSLRSVELVNASGKVFRFRGEVRIYTIPTPDSEPKYVETAFGGTGDQGPIELNPGERLLLATSTPPGYQWKVRTLASAGFIPAFEAVFIFQDNVALDGWVGTNYLSHGGKIPREADGLPVWSGSGAPGDSRGDHFRRVGHLRRASASDWVNAALTPPTSSGFELPLASVPHFVAVNPTRVKLEAGRWEGLVTISESASAMRLHVDDLKGITTESLPFTVLEGDSLRMEWPLGGLLREGGDAVTAQIVLAQAVEQEVIVSLFSSNPDEVMVPAEVRIPPRTLSASFQVTPVVDGLVDGPRLVQLSASAFGFRSFPPMTLTNYDSSETALHLSAPDFVEVDSIGQGQIPLEIQLDQPLERASEARLSVSCVSHPGVTNLTSWLTLPSVVIAPGVRQVRLSLQFRNYPLAFPAQFRVAALIPGWQEAEANVGFSPRAAVPTLKWVTDTPLDSLHLTSLVWSEPGVARVSNALRLEISQSLDHDYPVRLISKQPEILKVPEVVTIRALLTSVRVPFQLDLRRQTTGPRLVNLQAATFDGNRAEFDSFVTDDEFSSIEVILPGASPSPLVSGLARSVLLILKGSLDSSDSRRLPSQCLFSGELPLSFDFKGQPIAYEGPKRVTFINGAATIPVRFIGTTRAFEFVVTNREGQVIRSAPLELVAGGSEPLAPADLALSQVAAPVFEMDGGVVLSLVVTNLGPAQARRVAVIFGTTTGNVLAQGKTKAIYPVGDLAPYEGMNLEVHLERIEDYGGFYGAYFSSEADNADPDTTNNHLDMEFLPKPPRPISAAEISLPGSDLAYCSETGLFYGSRSNSVPSIVEIDPRTAEVIRELPVFGNPGLLQVSSVGQQLYALMDGGTRLLRIDLKRGETNLSVVLPQPAQDLVIVPGTSNRVVVAGTDSQTRVFLDGALVSASSKKVSWLEADIDGEGVVGVGDRVWVSQDGSQWQSPAIEPSPTALSGMRWRADAGWRGWRDQFLSVSMSGQDVLPGYSLAYRPASGSDDLVVDPSSGCVYYAVTRSEGGLFLMAFDPRNPFSKKLQSLPEVRYASRLTRFGARGLAFQSRVGRIVFVESPIVEAGERTDVQVQLSLQSLNPEPNLYGMRLHITNAGPFTASNAVLLLRPAFGDALFDSEGDPVTTDAGNHVLSLGDLQPGQSIDLQFRGAMPTRETSLGVVRAEVFGNWVDSAPMNNLALRPRTQASERAFRFTRLAAPIQSPSRQEVFLPAQLPSFAFMDDPYALVVLDSNNGLVKRILPMAEPVSVATFSPDESVIYLVSGENRSLRRVDPQSGLTTGWSVLSGASVIRDLISPLGSQDTLVSLQRNATNGSRLVVHRDLAPVSDRPIKYQHLMQGEGPGDFFGALFGAVGPLERLRLQGDHLTLLSAPAAVSGSARSWVHPPGWMVVDSGELYSASNGAYAGKLWDRKVPQVVSANPTLPLVLTAQNDSTSDRQTHLQLWDVSEQRLVGERHVSLAIGELSLVAALAGQKCLLQAADGHIQVLDCPTSGVPEVAVGVVTSTERPSVGEPFSVTLSLTNRSASTLESASLVIDFGPLVVERVEGLGVEDAVWSKDADSWIHVDLGSVPSESYQQYRINLRSHKPVFVPLEVSFRSATFHRRSDESLGPVIWVGADLGSEQAAEFRVASSSRVSVWEGAFGRDEVWLGYRGLKNRLIKLELGAGAPTVSQVIPIPFSPEFLAIDADGESIYVAPTFGSVHRLRIGPGGVVDTSRLSGSRGEGYGVTGMASPSGKSGRLAVAERNSVDSRLILFEEDRLLTRQHFFERSADRLVFGRDDQLVAAVPRFGLFELAARPDGLTLTRGFAGNAPIVPFIHSSGTLFFQNGTTIDLGTTATRDTYPGSVMVLPDEARDSVYVLPVFSSFPPYLPRTLTAQLRGRTGSFWGVSSEAFSVGGAYRGLVGSNRLAIVSDSGASQAFVLVSLQSLQRPMSSLGIQAQWDPPVVPAGIVSTLRLAVTNYGPWLSSNVVVHLPDEFDSLFTHWVANENGDEVRREGAQLRINAIGPFKEFGLQFFARRVSAPTELSPKFGLVSSVPELVGAPASVEPRLRITESNGITASPITVRETDGITFVRINLHLTKPALTQVECRLETISGEAKSPSDYTPLVAVLKWEPGASEAFVDLRINGDRLPEPTETFRLRLSNPIRAAILSPEVVVTILDNDGPALLLPSLDPTEGDVGVKPVRLSVRLEAASEAPVRFYYQTVGDTAASGLDFSPVYGVLEFKPGDLEASVQVPVIGDRVAERDERLLVDWQPVDGWSNLGGAASILIRNDDPEAELRLTLSLQEGFVQIGCDSVQGVEYQLQRTKVLDESWESTGEVILGTGERIFFADSDGPDHDTSFYRVIMGR